MRKQVDMDVRVFPLGNGADSSMTHDQVSQYLKENYLLKPNADKSDKSYWELFHVDTNQVSAGVIYYQTTLVKWLDVA